MKRLALAAMLAWAVAPSAMAQDFNPGTVIGNVYQNPASGCGYGFGFDCYPPAYGGTPPPNRYGNVLTGRSANTKHRIRHVAESQR
jgi:hypothetical protein